MRSRLRSEAKGTNGNRRRRCRELLAAGVHKCQQEADFDGGCRLIKEAAILVAELDDPELDLRTREEYGMWAFNGGKFGVTIDESIRGVARAREYQREGRLSKARFEYSKMVFGLREVEAGEVLDCRNKWPEIRSRAIEVRDIAQRNSQGFWDAYAVKKLAACAARVGELRQARKWLAEVESLLSPSIAGAQQFLYCSYHWTKSLLERKLGNHANAVHHARKAVEQSILGGSKHYTAYSHYVLSEALQAQGNMVEALGLAEGVLTQSTVSNWRYERAVSGRLYSELLTATGQLVRATEFIRQALEDAVELSLAEDEVLCRLVLGDVLKRRSDPTAKRVLDEARILAAKRNYDDHRDEAERLLRTAA